MSNLLSISFALLGAVFFAGPASGTNLCDVRKSISLHSPACTDDGTCPHGHLESNVGVTLIAGRSAEPDLLIHSCSASNDKMLTPVYSASKFVTTIVMMKLVDEMMLSLDEPLSTYFEWWTASADDNRSQITLRHVLSMTAGFGFADCEMDKSGTVTNSECAKKVYDTYGTFPEGGMFAIPANITLPDPSSVSPGDYFLYGESSWIVAVALALEVTGADIFQDVFEEYITTPLDINAEDCNYDALDPRNVDGGSDLSCKAQEFGKILGSYYAGNILSNSSTNEIETTQTTNLKFPFATFNQLMGEGGIGDGYGLGNWEFLGTRHSAGLNGVIPLIDREAGYWALLFRDSPGSLDDSFGALYSGSNGIRSMINELYESDNETVGESDCDLSCSNAVPPPIDMGFCGEAAACFDYLGCSMFDQTTQKWNGLYELCNVGALFCANFFPDSSCFSKNGDSSPTTDGANPTKNTTALVEVETNVDTVKSEEEENQETSDAPSAYKQMPNKLLLYAVAWAGSLFLFK